MTARWHGVVGLALVLLTALLGATVRSAPLSLDQSTFTAVNAANAGVLGAVFSLGNVLGSVAIWTLLVVGTCAVFWVLGHRRAALILVLADLSAEAASFTLKALVDRARPTTGLVADIVATASFPSGHVVRATAVLLVLLAIAGWRPASRASAAVGIAAYLLILGAARVASGEHWPSDVIGGYLLGAGWAALVLTAAEAWGRVRARSG